jgi:monoamine oxidase
VAEADLIILGAGAAGLAAARQLSGMGLSIVILEARDRVGGRIHTRHDPHAPVPLELGAEFVHGRPGETFDIIRAGGLSVVDAAETRVHLTDGKLKQIDFWAGIQKAMKAVSRVKRDVSFVDALDAAGKRVDRASREMAMSFVEGFDAADTARISVQSVIREQEDVADAEDAKNFRFVNGYDALPEYLRVGLDPARVKLHLDTTVTTVAWERGHVSVTTTGTQGELDQTFEARAALVTLPLGVLQSSPGERGAVAFDPPVPEKSDAAARLAAGPVMKVLLRFREPFWETLGRTRTLSRPKMLRDVAFWHARGLPIPTWWTSLPIRSTVLTGWGGGPVAAALAGKGETFVVGRAVESLSTILGVAKKEIESQLDLAIVNDWQSDPFARGAYSYVPVGGLDARRKLARPIQDTLFFAGEATNWMGQAGTVAGALASGYRAAGEIEKAFVSGPAPSDRG